MDKQVLKDRQTKLSARFSELQRSSEQKRQELEKIEDELKNIQGRYTELDEIIQLTPEPATEIPPEVPVSHVVTAKEKEPNNATNRK